MAMNCAISSILVPGDVGFDFKFNIGNITELKSAAVRTWAHYPTSKRIVEDILRFPAACEAVIAVEGAVVANIKRRGRRKCAKDYQKGAPEKVAGFCAPPRLCCGCSEARRSVGAVVGSADLSGPKK